MSQIVSCLSELRLLQGDHTHVKHATKKLNGISRTVKLYSESELYSLSASLLHSHGHSTTTAHLYDKHSQTPLSLAVWTIQQASHYT